MSILDKLDQYVKLKPWLEHVGLMLAFGGLVFIGHPITLARVVLYVGIALADTGFAYDLIYP